MKTSTIGALLALAVGLGAASTSFATEQFNPDINEKTILVRKSCSTTGTPANNCTETIAEALSWTWGTRHPSAANPLEMDIGPGTWAENWLCMDNGFVSVRGAGREVTKIVGDANDRPADLIRCTDLEFSDLTMEHPDIAVRWMGGGNSTWTDVNIISTGGGDQGIQGAWADDLCDPAQGIATHYFFGVRMRSRAQITNLYPPFVFWGECSDHWFYGGEIFWDASGFGDTGGLAGATGAAVLVGHDSTIHLFGTSLNVRVDSSANPIRGSLVAVKADSNSFFTNSGPSTFHMHGGIINVTVADGVPIHSGFDVTSLWAASSGSLIHVIDTAFTLNVPSGVVPYRAYADAGAKVLSPFQWQSGPLPPVATTEANVLVTDDGQDTFVETDCSASGDCNGGGSQSHLMVYNSTVCTDSANPWLDAITGRCRNDTNDPVAAALADLESRVSALEGQ